MLKKSVNKKGIVRKSNSLIKNKISAKKLKYKELDEYKKSIEKINKQLKFYGRILYDDEDSSEKNKKIKKKSTKNEQNLEHKKNNIFSSNFNENSHSLENFLGKNSQLINQTRNTCDQNLLTENSKQKNKIQIKIVKNNKNILLDNSTISSNNKNKKFLCSNRTNLKENLENIEIFNKNKDNQSKRSRNHSSIIDIIDNKNNNNFSNKETINFLNFQTEENTKKSPLKFLVKNKNKINNEEDWKNNIIKNSNKINPIKFFETEILKTENEKKYNSINFDSYAKSLKSGISTKNSNTKFVDSFKSNLYKRLSKNYNIESFKKSNFNKILKIKKDIPTEKLETVNDDIFENMEKSSYKILMLDLKKLDEKTRLDSHDFIKNKSMISNKFFEDTQKNILVNSSNYNNQKINYSEHDKTNFSAGLNLKTKKNEGLIYDKDFYKEIIKTFSGLNKKFMEIAETINLNKAVDEEHNKKIIKEKQILEIPEINILETKTSERNSFIFDEREISNYVNLVSSHKIIEVLNLGDLINKIGNNTLFKFKNILIKKFGLENDPNLLDLYDIKFNKAKQNFHIKTINNNNLKMDKILYNLNLDKNSLIRKLNKHKII